MRTLLRKTIRDLRSAWAQSTALTVTIALAVTTLISLAGAYRDLDESYNHTYDQLKFAHVTFSLSSAPEQLVDTVANIAGVAAVSGRLIVETGLPSPSEQVIRCRLIGVPAGNQPEVNALLIEEGDYLPKLDEPVALVESHFAAIYHIHPGDTVSPLLGGKRVEFRVVGVASSPEYLIVSPSRQDVLPSPRTFAVLFVPLQQLQRLAGAEDAVNDIAVRIEEEADRNSVISAIEAQLSPYGLTEIVPREEQVSNAALKLDLDGLRELADMMPGLIFMAGAMAVYAMLGRLVRSQQPQIGLMKALGYSNRSVMLHYLSLALVIGMLGSVLGIAGGLPLASTVTTMYASELGIPLVRTRMYPELIAESVLVSLFFAVLASVGPARASARMAPAAAMRIDPSVALAKGRTLFIEKILFLPLWLRMSLRNVFRARRRALTTALGIGLAYILILASWGFMDSMNYILHRQFTEVERGNLLLLFDSPQQPYLLEALKELPGIKKAQPFLQLPVTISAGEETTDLFLTALDPSQELHVLPIAGGLTMNQALADEKLVLPQVVAEKLGTDVGDSVRAGTPFGETELIVGGISQEISGLNAYISLATARQTMAVPDAFSGLYLLAEPSLAIPLRNVLYHIPGAASVQLKEDMESDWRELMSLAYAFIGVLSLFSLVMAFALLFNAMTVNVLERQRELATMRAIGAGLGRISLLVLAESLILWLLTTPLGLFLGHWVTVQLMHQFSSELMTFQVVIAPTSYAITASGILVTMILSSLPAIRHIGRLQLAEATKILT